MAKGLDLLRRDDGIFQFDPWREMLDFSRAVDDWFNRGFNASPPERFFPDHSLRASTPNISLYETPEEVVFTADLPGFTREEINLNVTSDLIQLSARHQEETQREAPVLSSGESRHEESSQEPPASDENQTDRKESHAIQASEITRDDGRRVYYIQGQQRRDFTVSYRLPTQIDMDRVEASFKNGALEVHMPKLQPLRHRRVQITAGETDGDRGRLIEGSSNANDSQTEKSKKRQTTRNA